MIIRFLITVILMINITPAIANDDISNNPYLEQLPKWANVLNEFVDDQGRIDFIRLANDTADLEEFIAAIEQVSPDSNPELFDTPEKVLAYHANAYNALAMIGVINRDIPKNFSSLLKRASFFKLRKVIIGGKTIRHHEVLYKRLCRIRQKTRPPCLCKPI